MFLGHGVDCCRSLLRVNPQRRRTYMNCVGYRRIRLFAFVVGLLVTSMSWVETRQAGGTVPIDPDDVGGVVTGGNGPEAGVWVIAETTSLPTKLARIVVTDDQGRYVIPDLPRGDYQVWVRGYGLVDSPRQAAKPGQQLNLKAVTAPS